MRTASAFREFGKLANAGDPEAQMQFGLLHVFGHGSSVDYEEGRFWLRQSALQGYTAAQINLGSIYARGIGTDVNLIKAYAWLKLGAEDSPIADKALKDVHQHIKENDQKMAEAMLTRLRLKSSRWSRPRSNKEPSVLAK